MKKPYFIFFIMTMPIDANPPGSACMTADENRQEQQSAYSNQPPYHYEGENSHRSELRECCECCCHLGCFVIGAMFSAVKKDVIDVLRQAQDERRD